MGHSVGIGLVAIIVFAIGESLSHQAHRAFDYYGSIISGIFMILLGTHFLGKLRRLKKRGFHILTENQPLSVDATVIGATVIVSEPESPVTEEAVPACVSFIAGIVGGAAGPGGLLAIVPAGYYTTWQESLAYILVFMISTTLIMGTVAWGYGELTFKLARDSDLLIRRIFIFSAASSILVGTLWIVLTLLGVLGADHTST